jgi:hypothetical protein
MPWSDLIGVAAGLLLAIPPIKDQYFRFARNKQETWARGSVFRTMRTWLAAASEDKRHEYSPWDSWLLAGGAGSLVLSFALKALGG